MPTGYTRVLVPVDFSPSSTRALREATRLVGEGGEVVLVHVLRKLEPSIPFSATNRKTVTKLARQAKLDARTALEAMAEGVGCARVRTRVVTGLAHEKILAEAQRAKADAIVIGAHGQTLSERLLVGSTTERVLRKATLPIVVTPAPRTRQPAATGSG